MFQLIKFIFYSILDVEEKVFDNTVLLLARWKQFMRNMNEQEGWKIRMQRIM